MYRAIRLALQSEPQQVAPNPHVGAVLVYNGRVIGEGAHLKCGEAHAEVNCFKSVALEDISLIADSTLYVTLEPCSHTGNTPPCAAKIIEMGVKKVIIGCVDPNPKVSGRGIYMLRSSGVEVIVGILEDKCREVAKVFMTNFMLHRPYITLKWAESIDGYMDVYREHETQQPVKLSSPFTSMLVHRDRSYHTAILVGYKTLLLDHSQLTNRLWTGLSPHPYVIDPDGKSLSLLEGYDRGSSWTMITRNPTLSSKKCQIVCIPEGTSLIHGLIEHMSCLGESSLLVEGGAYTLTTFIESRLWDECHIERAPFALGNGIAAPYLRGGGCSLCQLIDGRTIIRLQRLEEVEDNKD